MCEHVQLGVHELTYVWYKVRIATFGWVILMNEP